MPAPTLKDLHITPPFSRMDAALFDDDHDCHLSQDDGCAVCSALRADMLFDEHKEEGADELKDDALSNSDAYEALKNDEVDILNLRR